ncbi:ankyrin, partial [Decorospora gaudefroyi]
MLAASNGHTTLVGSLLDSHATLHLKSRSDYTAVHHAVGNGKDSVVRLFLANEAIKESIRRHEVYKNLTPLYVAAQNGHETTVHLLLDYLGGIDSHNKARSQKTALQIASFFGRKNVIKLLLDANATVDLRWENAPTALWYAAVGGHEAVVGLLIDHGADINIKG